VFQCDECNVEVKEGYVCPKCRRILCSSCGAEKVCSFCSNSLIDFEIENEKKNGYNIHWVCFSGGKEFGLVRFSTFPAIAYRLVELLPLLSGDYKLILFQSSQVSRKFMRYQDSGKKDHILGSTEGTAIKGSRYRLLLENMKQAYVLLNATRTKESDIAFLIRFLNGLFKYLRAIPVNDLEHVEKVGWAVVECLHQYNKKFGVEFVSITKFLAEWSADILVKLRTLYFEQKALRNLAANDNLGSEILEYVSGKMKLIFSSTQQVNEFADIMNLAGSYINSVSLLSALSSNQKLYSIAKNKFDREDSKTRKRMRKNEDIIEAIEELEKKLIASPEYSSFQDFVECVSECFISFFKTVKPKYMWLNGAEPLAEASKWYLERIENRSFAVHPKFGNIDTFLELLSNVFDQLDSNPDIYPEPSIECGTLLLELLKGLVRFEKTESYFQRALSVGRRLSSKIEKNTVLIKSKNRQSLFDHVQAASILLELATMCTNHKRWDITVNLLDEAIVIAQKYDLTQIEVRAYWTKFLLTQNYEQLLHVYKLHLRTPKDKSDYVFPKVMALLLSGIFEKNNRIANFQEAADISFTQPVEEQSFLTTTDFLDHLFVQRLSYYLCNLFLNVAKAEMENNPNKMLAHLLKARPFTSALEAESNMPMASENVFSWKTMILIGILTNDEAGMNKSIKKLEQFPCRSKTNKYFLAKVQIFRQNNNNWTNKINTLVGPTENKDIWCRLLEKIINVKVRDPLIKRLSKISKGVLFIEGPTEEEVLPVMARKLGLDLEEIGIELFPLRGASKARIKIKFWKEVTEKISVPLFILVDSDGQAYAKKAVDEGLIKQENSFVLSKGTIEDYYPIEVLRRSIGEMCGKEPDLDNLQGKKEHAIDSYLKKNNYRGEWKICLGRKVAQAMTESQVDSEIRELLKKTAASSS